MEPTFRFPTPLSADITPAPGKSLSEFSHELRSPLTLIRAYLQLATRKGLGRPESESMIEGALRATVRMEEILQEMVQSRVS